MSAEALCFGRIGERWTINSHMKMRDGLRLNPATRPRPKWPHAHPSKGPPVVKSKKKGKGGAAAMALSGTRAVQAVEAVA